VSSTTSVTRSRRPHSEAVASHRGRVAGLSRDRAPDDPDLVDARRSLAAARLEDYIEKTVAAAPPLTAAQRARLRDLLAEDGQ
jgi:hypothetical protein